MNKRFLVAIGVALLTSLSVFNASAWDLKDLLGGGNGSNAVTNILEGVLTKTDISVADMAGVWRIDGSAVSFKSENFLAKAGGVAAAGVIESKLDPYYKQYGLTGGTITINADGTFKMTVKKMTLSGNITKNSDGSFEFKFMALGAISIGSLTTYVQQPPNKLEIMLDATKLKALISAVANFSGMDIAKTAVKLLDSYEGLCVGFEMTKTGNVSTPASGATSTSSGLGGIFNILGGSSNNSGINNSQGNNQETNNVKSGNTQTTTTVTTNTQKTNSQPTSESQSTTSSAIGSALSGLFKIFGGGK